LVRPVGPLPEDVAGRDLLVVADIADFAEPHRRLPYIGTID
jgi:hypoxanthine-guanine phosphoribosyltransferase